jgi:membrane dipeptidase
MTGNSMTPIFDGHNDVLLRLWLKDSTKAVSGFIDGGDGGQLDLPRMHDGGMVGGLFAIYTPSHEEFSHNDLNPPAYSAVSRDQAWAATRGMAETLFALEREVPNRGFTVCLTVGDIRAAVARGSIAAVFHIEGAEAIGPKLEGLHELHAMGLRSIGPVWSRPNVFGHGVPFAFPSSPDTGDGLTEAGKDLVRECNALKIMLDCSHLNQKGFWDLAKLTDAPLVASHSNVHALSQSSRNLLDDQIKAIGESGGLIGLNYALDFLQNDGKLHPDLPPSEMIRHLDYLLRVAGEDCVGLGSDFDGATVPHFIGDVSGVQRLVSAMKAAGYSANLIRKITSENWLRVLDRSWGA